MCSRPGARLGRRDRGGGAGAARAAEPGFFTAAGRAVAEPLLDLSLAQGRRTQHPGLPALIDTRLAIGETDGYDDLPEAGQSWRDKLAHIRHQISRLAVLHPDHRGVLSTEHPALPTGGRLFVPFPP